MNKRIQDTRGAEAAIGDIKKYYYLPLLKVRKSFDGGYPALKQFFNSSVDWDPGDEHFSHMREILITYSSTEEKTRQLEEVRKLRAVLDWLRWMRKNQTKL